MILADRVSIYVVGAIWDTINSLIITCNNEREEYLGWFLVKEYLGQILLERE
jgi:hypothetical protein